MKAINHRRKINCSSAHFDIIYEVVDISPWQVLTSFSVLANKRFGILIELSLAASVSVQA